MFNQFIDRGVGFLAREQQPDGSFFCLVSTMFDDYSRAMIVPAIVPTNIVLSSLIRFPETEEISRIKCRAAKFLLTEKSEYWSFNYWFRGSDWYAKEPYPDDLDDTCCALAALYEYDATFFDHDALSKIVTMLASAEKKEGGPYDMWLVPPEGRTRWNDTDLVVNSNVGFFLSLVGINLPNLNAFIEQSIDRASYEFPYNTIYPAIYFISRFYAGERAEQMIELLLAKQESDGKWENPLRTALALTALINFSGNRFLESLERGVAYLKTAQQADGSWPASSFFFQMKTPEKTLYAGSASTTTALCVEALGRCREL